MPGPSDKIAFIQNEVNDRLAAGVQAMQLLGGDAAVTNYLNRTLQEFLHVAIGERGVEGAYRLMIGGFKAAEAYERNDGRRAH